MKITFNLAASVAKINLTFNDNFIKLGGFKYLLIWKVKTLYLKTSDQIPFITYYVILQTWQEV